VPGCAIGQQIILNLPTFSVTNYPLVIKRIEAVGYAPGANGMLQYQVEAIGSDNVTFVDLMQSILQQETNQTPVDDSTILEDLVPVSEALSLSDAATVTSNSRPYKYGAGSPQARYGFAVYS
jgi:hypothetical protein